MNVESLVILHESVVFVLGPEVWVLEAVVRALVLAQGIVAAQVMVPEAHDIDAVQAMVTALEVHQLEEGANLRHALEVFRLLFAAAEALADRHHPDAIAAVPL
jgi:hypothetical protein